MIGAAFSCYPATGSFARTVIMDLTGARILRASDPDLASPRLRGAKSVVFRTLLSFAHPVRQGSSQFAGLIASVLGLLCFGFC